MKLILFTFDIHREHILEILAIAERHFVPIIADEVNFNALINNRVINASSYSVQIYEHFVFPGNEYHSVSSLSRNVPVLSCGGLTKRFLVC